MQRRSRTAWVARAVACCAWLAHCAAFGPDSNLSCLDEKANPIEWWFTIKLPNGFQYAYYDSKSTEPTIKVSPHFLNTTRQYSLASTLGQVYIGEGSESIAYVAYNDEAPQSASADGLPRNLTEQQLRKMNGSAPRHRNGSLSAPRAQTAHAKGVLAGSANGGFWLVHSVPKFPDLDAAKFEWEASTIYAQSFLCMSLDKANLNQAITQILTMQPNIIFSHLPGGLIPTFPQMSNLINRQWGSSTERVYDLSTVGGTKMTSFAKGPTWGDDLYEQLVEPHYGQDMMWETWRRPPVLPTYCKPQYPFNSLNIENISLGAGYEWKYTKSHCKWGISTAATTPIVCVGGINRMSSQRKRGGGTVCLVHRNLYTVLSAVVAGTDSC